MTSDFKIVADSSADLFDLEGIDFGSAPLKICRKDKEYVDDSSLNVEEMVDELLSYQDKVSTACPAIGDWLNAFGDSKLIIAFAISSRMSGSYNSLLNAKSQYEEEFPDRRVLAINSKNAGPGIRLLIYKAQELINEGKGIDEIEEYMNHYVNESGLLFMLESLHNFANNGRVNPLVAKAVGLLGIKVIGERGDEGTLEIIEKKRGENKAVGAIVKLLPKKDCLGKKFIIGHVLNEKLANEYKRAILEVYPDADIEVYQMHGLCSFYAEKGGVLIAFEREFNR